MTRTIRYENALISYKREGKGKSTLVFLHGFMENKHFWDTFVSHFTTSYDVIAPDFFGHGASENLQRSVSMEVMADMVRSVLAYEGVEKAHLIGHSMGGYVAIHMAKLFPEYVESIVLINSTAQADSEEKKKNRNKAMQLVKINQPLFVRTAFTQLFGTSARLRLKDIVELLIQSAQNTSLQGILSATEAMKNRVDSVSFLKELPVKKLYITGKDDALLELSQMEQQARQVQAQIACVEGGHMSHIECEKEVAEIILKFISE